MVLDVFASLSQIINVWGADLYPVDLTDWSVVMWRKLETAYVLNWNLLSVDYL